MNNPGLQPGDENDKPIKRGFCSGVEQGLNATLLRMEPVRFIGILPTRSRLTD